MIAWIYSSLYFTRLQTSSKEQKTSMLLTSRPLLRRLSMSGQLTDYQRLPANELNHIYRRLNDRCVFQDNCFWKSRLNLHVNPKTVGMQIKFLLYITGGSSRFLDPTSRTKDLQMKISGVLQGRGVVRNDRLWIIVSLILCTGAKTAWGKTKSSMDYLTYN